MEGEATNNWDAALKAEVRRVVRGFHRHGHTERADLAASHRLGYRQRTSIGEAFYTHPDLPGVCFPTRTAAARAALSREAE